jgi:hypothetical protein
MVAFRLIKDRDTVTFLLWFYCPSSLALLSPELPSTRFCPELLVSILSTVASFDLYGKFKFLTEQGCIVALKVRISCRGLLSYPKDPVLRFRMLLGPSATRRLTARICQQNVHRSGHFPRFYNTYLLVSVSYPGSNVSLRPQVAFLPYIKIH